MLETPTPVKKDYFVHESSYVDEPTEIGSGTSIWHFSHILKDCKLGRDCKIGQNVVIGPNVIIGNNVKIQNNVSIYSGVTVEDDVFCGPSMVFTNVFIPRSAIPRNTEADFLKTLIKKGASIGANATIVCGNTVGRYALVGAGSVVTKDVLDHALVYGNPARQHGWACYCGAPMGKLNRGELKTADTITCPQCEREYQRSENGLTPVDVQ